jgi:hypothetical protein
MRLHLRSLAVIALLGSASVWAQSATTVEVYKSPTCGCCGKWIEHMQKNGFKVEAHEVDDIPASRKKLGMPDKLGSCHTSKIGNYVVEGHVPAQDIKRLLKEKPKALGLAIPSMPPGVPGMDIPNSPPYETLLVQADGTTSVFAKH